MDLINKIDKRLNESSKLMPKRLKLGYIDLIEWYNEIIQNDDKVIMDNSNFNSIKNDIVKAHDLMNHANTIITKLMDLKVRKK